MVSLGSISSLPISGNEASAAAGGDIAGSSSLTFTTSATLIGLTALIGASTLTFSLSGSVVGNTALIGSTSLVFTTSGTVDPDPSADTTSLQISGEYIQGRFEPINGLSHIYGLSKRTN